MQQLCVKEGMVSGFRGGIAARVHSLLERVEQDARQIDRSAKKVQVEGMQPVLVCCCGFSIKLNISSYCWCCCSSARHMCQLLLETRMKAIHQRVQHGVKQDFITPRWMRMTKVFKVRCPPLEASTHVPTPTCHCACSKGTPGVSKHVDACVILFWLKALHDVLVGCGAALAKLQCQGAVQQVALKVCAEANTWHVHYVGLGYLVVVDVALEGPILWLVVHVDLLDGGKQDTEGGEEATHSMVTS